MAKIKTVKKIKSRRIKKINVKKPRPGKKRSPGKILLSAKKNEAIKRIAEEALAYQQIAIEKSKFSMPMPVPSARFKLPQELPADYGKDTIVAVARDPRFIFTYWEVTPQTWERVNKELNGKAEGCKRALRVFDITNVNFNGSNANRFFDVELSDYSNNWYIDTGSAGTSWCVDFGLKLRDGRFISILRSNAVHLPLEGPSRVADEEWMVPEEIFARLYGMGFGFGKSSPGKGWAERFKQALYSGALFSPGVSSMSSPAKKAQKKRKFWLEVDCELIVYGATEPDAQVTVQDKPVNLRRDGTFTLRFALPDGKNNIPVKAVSSDGEEEKKITPIVIRQTQ